jgi:hypothetical protein
MHFVIAQHRFYLKKAHPVQLHCFGSAHIFHSVAPISLAKASFRNGCKNQPAPQTQKCGYLYHSFTIIVLTKLTDHKSRTGIMNEMGFPSF